MAMHNKQIPPEDQRRSAAKHSAILEAATILFLNHG